MKEQAAARCRISGIGSIAWLAIGLAVALGLMPIRGFCAGFPPAYVVANVPVDATAASPVEAKESARLQGQQTAFKQLLQRLTLESDWPRLPNLDAQAITNYVADFQVESEHSSAVRYLAKYTFRFNPGAVRELLRRSGIPFVDQMSKPVIIVPVLKAGDAVHLWDDPNPWREAWNASSGKKALVSWIVPAGDIEDVQSFDVQDALQPTPDKLQALSQRYNNDDVVVVVATRTGEGKSEHLDISVSHFVPDGTPDTGTLAVDATPDQTAEQAGVNAVADLLGASWKKQFLAAEAPPPVPAQEVEVSIPITGPAEFAQVRSALARVSMIRSALVEQMSRREVRMKLAYQGDQDALQTALAQQDLTLNPGDPMPRLTIGAGGALPPAAPSE